jgi:hypothetical protein
MSKEEAAKLLEIAPDAAAASINQKYAQMYSEYMIRITNAPTPELKTAFEKKLEELGRAAAVLRGNSVPSDLPSTHPRTEERKQTPGAGQRPEHTPQDVSMPRSTVFAWVVAIVLAGLCTLLALRWAAARGAEAAAMKKVAEVEGNVRALTARTTELERVVKNGRFQVCNASSGALTITSLVVGYFGANKIQIVNSAYYGYPSWSLAPGARKTFEFVRGQTVVWDGAVAFYALEVSDGNDEYVLSGSWADVKGDCLKLSLDH